MQWLKGARFISANPFGEKFKVLDCLIIYEKRKVEYIIRCHLCLIFVPPGKIHVEYAKFKDFLLDDNILNDKLNEFKKYFLTTYIHNETNIFNDKKSLFNMNFG
jgi:hypothetical protein